MKIEPTRIELHPKQFDAYSFTAQFGACICGVQSGKTYLGAVWAQKKIQEYPTSNGLIAAPTVKILQHSTLEKFFGLFPEYRKYYKEQKGEIELPSGAKIFIRSTDDPLGVEGMTINWAWLDEAGMMKRMMWLVIKARVSTTRGQVLMTTTPYNLGWLYQEVYLPWKEKTDPDLAVFTWKSVENPYFPADYYEKEKNRLGAEEFARRYEGEFTRLEGLIWELPNNAVVHDSPMLERILRFPDRVIGGLDWGYHNPTGLLVVYVKDATYYVMHEWKAAGKTTPEIIDRAKIYAKDDRVTLWFPDPAEPDRIEEMKRFGLPIGDTNKDVLVGLSHVGALLREGRLLIHSSCRELLDEIGQYQWEENTEGKAVKERPLKVDDHLCDALRYALMGYRPYEPKNKNTAPIEATTYAVTRMLLQKEGAMPQSNVSRALL